ncbi:hypothetical protein VNO80_09180 [Phaseolus coccineus]|uniref:Uncharacterized protein n=1 Tax=Phaseolus coccineus TaxID=3886 RepID=A0AAN9N6C3_PHACN
MNFPSSSSSSNSSSSSTKPIPVAIARTTPTDENSVRGDVTGRAVDCLDPPEQVGSLSELDWVDPKI